jgi:transcriptional regulator with XRE-family HTH domain
MTLISAEQCRAARALLLWSQSELASRANVAKQTIQHFEIGKRQPYKRTLDDIVEALSSAGVEFIEPIAGRHVGGVALKEGATSALSFGTQGNATSQGDDASGLDALPWDWEAEAAAPLEPFDHGDEGREEMVAYWRARPEKWAALHEVSRQCLVRTMGVERL